MTSSSNTPVKPKPATIMTAGEAMVPGQAYQLPQFMLNSYSPDIGWRSESRKAARHAMGLMMQAYGLAWMEMFEEHRDLQGVGVQVEEEGRMVVETADGVETAALARDIGRINELCDPLILPFIKDLLLDREVRRQGLDEAISQSYDFIARPLGLAPWGDSQDKRASVLEACLLEENTEAATAKRGGPRL